VNVADDEPGPSDAVLQESNCRNVVSRHYPVEDVMLAFHVGSIDSNIAEVDACFVKQDEPGPLASFTMLMTEYSLAVLVKDRTSIDQLGLLLRHCLGTSFGIKYPFIVVVSQCCPEILAETLLVHLLQTQNVRIMGS
jgi:hypothetical protein